MKLVITIPAYNEESSLEKVLASIPENIKSISELEVLVIDDGSTDLTAEVAKKHSAQVLLNGTNRGLAQTYQNGLNQALLMGADIIVNLDADNQYDSHEIELLIHKLLREKADMVVGDRQVKKLDHMPLLKKYGNVIGSFFVRITTGLNVKDASSGFRALTREAALRLQILSSHTYTHESLIQAAFWNFKVLNVPITFRRRDNGKSRLIGNVFSHIWKSLGTILRALAMYKPFKKFLAIGSVLFAIGLAFEIRYLIIFLTANGSGHVQSVILGATFMLFGVLMVMMGFIADLIVANRRIQSEVLYRLKKNEIAKHAVGGERESQSINLLQKNSPVDEARNFRSINTKQSATTEKLTKDS